ncbi:MAG: hypothetical protein CSA25_06185 [Desulfobacter postgatei]|uniref:Uncharacterized protein n=1 Tax=Desulfobacter postgatei TaxID=2293 RepID=A0A2G6MQ62_9BACT|nr:MAG: hypothetical protein CSA25_06185 [Desulfobacter postgatei]
MFAGSPWSKKLAEVWESPLKTVCNKGPVTLSTKFRATAFRYSIQEINDVRPLILLQADKHKSGLHTHSTAVIFNDTVYHSKPKTGILLVFLG